MGRSRRGQRRLHRRRCRHLQGDPHRRRHRHRARTGTEGDILHRHIGRHLGAKLPVLPRGGIHRHRHLGGGREQFALHRAGLHGALQGEFRLRHPGQVALGNGDRGKLRDESHMEHRGTGHPAGVSAHRRRRRHARLQHPARRSQLLSGRAGAPRHSRHLAEGYHRSVSHLLALPLRHHSDVAGIQSGDRGV